MKRAGPVIEGRKTEFLLSWGHCSVTSCRLIWKTYRGKGLRKKEAQISDRWKRPMLQIWDYMGAVQRLLSPRGPKIRTAQWLLYDLPWEWYFLQIFFIIWTLHFKRIYNLEKHIFLNLEPRFCSAKFLNTPDHT